MINTILAQYEQEAYASYENVTGTIIRKPDGSLKNEYGHNDAVDAYRHATTVPLTFKVETSEYERRDTGYADHLAIKPSSHVFQIN